MKGLKINGNVIINTKIETQRETQCLLPYCSDTGFTVYLYYIWPQNQLAEAVMGWICLQEGWWLMEQIYFGVATTSMQSKMDGRPEDSSQQRYPTDAMRTAHDQKS